MDFRFLAEQSARLPKRPAATASGATQPGAAASDGVRSAAQSAAQQPRPSQDSGIAALGQAIAQGFSDPSLLARSFTAFQQTLKQNPRHQEALLGTAYLLFLIEADSLARLYLDSLLKLAPGHEGGLQLLSGLDARPPERSALRTATDYDGLYDSVEAQLKRSLEQWLRLRVPDFKTLIADPACQHSTRARLQTLLSLQAQLNTQLECIDQEIDVTDLRNQAKLFEQLTRRYETGLSQLAGYHSLEQQILSAGEATRAFQQRVQAVRDQRTALQAFEAELEGLLDHSDAIADRLDEMDNQGLAIEGLIQHYHALIHEIEELQEQLDSHDKQAA